MSDEIRLGDTVTVSESGSRTVDIGKLLAKDEVKQEIKRMNNKVEMGNDSEEYFTRIYATRWWGNGITSSASGPGSNIAYTEHLRQQLPVIFDKFNIKTLLDAPCGDMMWMGLVLSANPQINYIGGDIVKELIEDKKKTFAGLPWRFIHMNIINEPLPDADMFFCRDCLFHLTNENIKKVFDNFLRSEIPYIMTTSHPEDSVVNHGGVTYLKNTELPASGFRKLNLMDDPWNLPEPLYRVTDWVEPFPKREMCVWSREQLLAWRT